MAVSHEQMQNKGGTHMARKEDRSHVDTSIRTDKQDIEDQTAYGPAAGRRRDKATMDNEFDRTLGVPRAQCG